MKDTKNNIPSPEMLGAISQAKQIHAQLSRSGVPVPAVNPESVKDGGLLYEYLNAIHEAVVRNGLQIGGSKPSPSARPSTVSSNYSFSEQELEEIIKKTATVALQEHDDKVQEKGGFTFPHLYNRYLETKKANGSIISGFCHEYHPIIEQYQKIIEDQKAGEMEKYNKDITLSKSVDKLTEDLAPVIEENSITFWTFVRRRFTKWRKQSRWRNPFTYIYILIGLMYVAITVCPAVVNLDLKRTNKGAKAIIYEYLLVDMAMSGNEDYQEERLKIHESVEKKGLYATWEETQELRPNFDNSISEPNRKE